MVAAKVEVMTVAEQLLQPLLFEALQEIKSFLAPILEPDMESQSMLLVCIPVHCSSPPRTSSPGIASSGMPAMPKISSSILS